MRLLLGLLVFAVFEPAWAQDVPLVAPAASGQLQVLKTRDGQSYEGTVLKVSDGVMTFVTSDGPVEIPVENIVSVDPVSRRLPSASSSSGTTVHPNQTRLFFAPTGRSLPAGSGYVADHYLFFPSFAIGVTDRLTIGGGFSFIPGVSITDQLLFATPKLGLVTGDNLNLAVGAIIAGFPGVEDIEGAAGVLYGVGTMGPTDRHLSVGVGYGFAGEDLAEKPVFMVGGEARVSKTVALVSENWLVPGEAPLLSAGCRLFGERFSVDLAIVAVPGSNAVAFPYIDVVYAFGR